MTTALTSALKELIQATFLRHWEEDDKGDYKPLDVYEYALPPRVDDGQKPPFVALFPQDGEDDNGEEISNIMLVVCVHCGVPPLGGDRAEAEKALFEQQTEGNARVVNMMSALRKAIRQTPIVGERFRYTGNLKWQLMDNNSQPTPFFYGTLNVEYESMIINAPKIEEIDAYGSR